MCQNLDIFQKKMLCFFSGGKTYFCPPNSLYKMSMKNVLHDIVTNLHLQTSVIKPKCFLVMFCTTIFNTPNGINLEPIDKYSHTKPEILLERKRTTQSTSMNWNHRLQQNDTILCTCTLEGALPVQDRGQTRHLS